MVRLGMPRSLLSPHLPTSSSERFPITSSRGSKAKRKRMALPPVLNTAFLRLSGLFLVVVVLSVLASSLFASHCRYSAPEPARQGTCRSVYDAPNPLADAFPEHVTGLINATLAIVLIPLAQARAIIPPQYRILDAAYRALVPDFPQDMYPVMLQAAHDHDVAIKAYGFTVPDFSRVGFEFPFLDLLNDGHSTFRWAPSQLITASHVVAIEGSRAYGTRVSGASFDPPCEAYGEEKGEMIFRGSTSLQADNNKTAATATSQYIDLRVRRQSTLAWPIGLFINMTNQPIFASPNGTCDHMIRLFNTTSSSGQAKPVSGRVYARGMFPPSLGSGEAEHDLEWVADVVHGVQVATPFVEHNYLGCETLAGYLGTGDGGVG